MLAISNSTYFPLPFPLRILSFNLEILAALHSRLEDWSSDTCVGDIFVTQVCACVGACVRACIVEWRNICSSLCTVDQISLRCYTMYVCTYVRTYVLNINLPLIDSVA